MCRRACRPVVLLIGSLWERGDDNVVAAIRVSQQSQFKCSDGAWPYVVFWVPRQNNHHDDVFVALFRNDRRRCLSFPELEVAGTKVEKNNIPETLFTPYRTYSEGKRRR